MRRRPKAANKLVVLDNHEVGLMEPPQAYVMAHEQPAAKPRKVHWPLAFLAAGLALVGLTINAWFAWSRGIGDLDKALFAGIGLFTEAAMFFLPTQMAAQWRARNFGAFLVGCICLPLLFCFALLNSLGFASTNLADTATVRAERISPAILDTQRKLDTLAQSREAECRKRGPMCRQLEADERAAMDQLATARQQIAASADPQVSAATRLVAWASMGRLNPSADDFANLRLLLLTVLPQFGGLILMMAVQPRNDARVGMFRRLFRIGRAPPHVEAFSDGSAAALGGRTAVPRLGATSGRPRALIPPAARPRPP